MKTNEREFLNGFSVAVATLIKCYDAPTLARTIIEENGFSLSDFENAKIEEFDLEYIRQAFE